MLVDLSPTKSAPRIVRAPDFARRLDHACDAHAHVPPRNHGRLTWVKRSLEAFHDEDVSVETVRKWFAGEAKPRPDKIVKLAEMLGVDVGWLSLGIDPVYTPRERTVRHTMAEGAVNAVAGLIQIDGGHPAFPDQAQGPVDLHAIIKGAKYDLHIALADELGGRLHFTIAEGHEAVIVLGLRKTGLSFEIFELPVELIHSEGTGHGAHVSLVLDPDDVRMRRITSFQNRL
jgi:hypothetical protein